MTQTHTIDPERFETFIADKLSPRSNYPFKEFPEFPVALNAQMPEHVGFEQGDIGLGLHQFGLSAPQGVQVEKAGQGLHVTIAELALRGMYRIAGKKTVPMDMDTAGTMLDLPNRDLSGGAAADGDPLSPDQTNAMLDQAREQRTKLRETQNGQAMVDQFNSHNEQYNTAFVTQRAMRNNWTKGGATKEMALHSSDAVKAGNVTINPKAKTFGTDGVTYNGNAFAQQLNVMMGTLSVKYNLFRENPKPDNPYTKAALAALTFGNGINDTGNTNKDAQEMDADTVFSTVGSANKPADATMEQLENAIAQAVSGDGGAAAAADAEAQNWLILDEDQRVQVRTLLYEIELEKLEREGNHPVLIWSGLCSSVLRDVQAQLHFGDDGTLDDISITLPAFAVDLDDAKWDGPTGDVVRDRLKDMRGFNSPAQRLTWLHGIPDLAF